MKQLILTASFGFFLLSSCASGRVNWRERGYGSEAKTTGSVQKDTLRTKNSSYRVRGTDEVGSLTPRQHAVLRAKTQGWRWPLNAIALTSRFGHRSGEFHDGVDLRAPSGTAVYAVAPGKVIYSGAKISGYGRMVVLRHSGKLSTIYAHNSRLLVKAGQNVRRGQLIAQSGNTGRSSGPHVHFEVREGVTAINPSVLLQTPSVHNEAYRRIANSPKNVDRVKSGASARGSLASISGKAKNQAARLASSDSDFKARVNHKTP